MVERLRRLPGALRALRVGRELETHDAWDREQLRVYQRARLLDLIRHAARRSPYYRERFAGIAIDDDLDLTELPTIDKATMLEHFDDLVTDSRLNLAGVQAHLEEVERAGPKADPTLFGEYRAMASGGSSGRRGVFVYGKKDWAEGMAGAARVMGDSYIGLGARLPRPRSAAVFAENLIHSSARVSRSFDVGTHRILRLDVRAGISELVEELNAFQPEGLGSYASIAALLAEQQLTGDLRISPRVVWTTGEVRTAEMESRIVAAWGTTPFNVYGASEAGFMAANCDRHAGLHAFEDQVHIEVVDDDRRPVPSGRPGRLLITSLINRTQPLIRYELNDLVTVSPHPCPCGRPFPLLESVDGRSDDVLEMPAVAGGTLQVHPLTLRSPMAGVATVLEYRIVYGPGELLVEVVLRNGDEDGSARSEVEARLASALAEHGVQTPPIRVEDVGHLPRHPQSGKRKLVEMQAG